MNSQAAFDEAKRNKVNFIALLLFCGTLIAFFYYYNQSIYEGRGYPYNTFLFMPQDKFNDFFNTLKHTENLNPYFEKYPFNSNYYPFLHILLYPLTFLRKWAALCLFLSLFLGLLFKCNYRYLKTENVLESIKNVLIITFCNYSVLFVIDRGNFEGFLFLFVAGFFIALEKRRETLACFFLAAAIASKLYPAVFIVLLIADKKYKAALKTGVLVLLLTVGSLLLFNGGFLNNINYISRGFSSVREISRDIFTVTESIAANESEQIGTSEKNGTSKPVQTTATAQFPVLNGVSLFTAFRIVVISQEWTNLIDFKAVLRYYAILVIAIFLGLSYVIYLYPFKLWEKTFLLVSVMLLFPHLSCDYKLIFLYLPLWFLINEKTSSKREYLYLASIGLLLIPKNYVLIQGVISNSGTADLSTGIFINIFILVAVSVSILINGFHRQNSLYISQIES